MNPINKELFEKGFGNVPSISEQFTGDPRVQIGSGKGISVIYITSLNTKSSMEISVCFQRYSWILPKLVVKTNQIKEESIFYISEYQSVSNIFID